ncbi:acyl-CoA-binding domain-containing protein 3-like isoform X2 [Musa acuminata AAA Group]|uniref:acyl-CoA-binding domain-containing protein 3-like isoform X2 n=1 Tax=Musa acuminata AAA Group TaxID=214697 RepID=UPI0031E027D5
MEFYVELFLTALISVLIAFLIGKIAAADDNVDDEDLAADKSAPPPLSADSGPRRMESTAAAAAAIADLGMGLGAAQEEETGKSSGDACASGVVEDQRLDEEILDSGKAASGFDLQKQDTILGADESSSKKEGSKVGIGIISGDLEEVEPNVGKEVRKVVEMGGEDTLQRGDARAVSEERGGSLLQGEDEWEGIERSELEKLFGVATEFVGSEKGGDAVSKLSSELQMQLYGLHRVATEGSCYEPQPMALKVTARAKWTERFVPFKLLSSAWLHF